MLRFILHRTGFGIVTLLVIITSVFFLLRAAPGGPFDGERALPPEIEANLRAAYNLDAPLIQQYGLYLGGILQGDFGPSFRQKDFDVGDLIHQGLPTSAVLGGCALLLAVVLGLAIGIPCGMRPGSWLDMSLMSITNLNLAVPTIVAAPLLILVFSVTLSWLPAGGITQPGHLILPVVALSLPYVAAIARLIRGSVAEAYKLPHITTAKAKGLGPIRIVFAHTLPIAAIPLVSFLGPAAAGLLTGSVVVEQVFELPGIGRYFVQGALARDYTLVMGVVIVYASGIVFFNMLVDLVYGWLDPRIRVGLE